MLEDELPSKFVLPINADALRSAMENILRNGLRQTPAGSRLSVTLTATSRFVRISLCDHSSFAARIFSRMESAFGFISVPSAAASSVELPHHFVFSGVTNDATADKTGSGGAFHSSVS